MSKTIFFGTLPFSPWAILATWLDLGVLLMKNEIIHKFCIPTLITVRLILPGLHLIFQKQLRAQYNSKSNHSGLPKAKKPILVFKEFRDLYPKWDFELFHAIAEI